MKCLSLTQPWATLIAIGAKRIETRSWPTAYRGPLAIHASKAFPAEAVRIAHTARFVDAWARHYPSTALLPRGAVIATCRLIGCLPMTEHQLLAWRAGGLSEQELAFGHYEPGRFAWMLADVVSLPVPIPARGALGLWDWEMPT